MIEISRFRGTKSHYQALVAVLRGFTVSAAKFTESAVKNGSNFEKLQKNTKKLQNVTKNRKNFKIGQKLEKYQILSIFSISMDF